MTQVTLQVAVGVIVEDEPELFQCEWKDCPEKKVHRKKPDYPGGGTVARNSSYSSNWVSAGLEPWVKYGPGKDSKATLIDYRGETKKAAYAVTAAALEHPEYHTQKHHLISVNLFKNVSKLSHDAKLVGYDVNHKNNGICLPTYKIDIIRHDLQAHRGSHPNNHYNLKIEPLLEKLEEACIKYCELDIDGDTESQKELVEDLNRLSRRIEVQIKAWKWLLRKEATTERAESIATYAART